MTTLNFGPTPAPSPTLLSLFQPQSNLLLSFVG
jgi:hypothetical protein